MKKLAGSGLLLMLAAALFAQSQRSSSGQPAAGSSMGAQEGAARAEDISGMYTFLHEGEFIQINADGSAVSGYISRMGDQQSDQGQHLDQFFSKAAVQGHDVSFTTRQLHGAWFEFTGRFDRGSARSRAEEGYYLIRGTLTEFVTDADRNVTSRSRQVEFKLMRLSPDEIAPPSSGNRSSN